MIDNEAINQLKMKTNVGDKFKSYYGNGSYMGIVTITKISDKSVWTGETRESWNTVLGYVNKKMWTKL